MHRISYSVRRIAPADLPKVRDLDGGERAATIEELANMDIVPLGDDYYSCADQVRSDDEVDVTTDANGRPQRQWHPVGVVSPGVELATGNVNERCLKLPVEAKELLLRAEVIRSDEPGGALAIAEANIVEQMAALEQFVGDVERDGESRPLVELESDRAIVDEARRLAALPDSGVERMRVSMRDVVRGEDVVEAEGIAPHAFAGERWQG